MDASNARRSASLCHCRSRARGRPRPCRSSRGCSRPAARRWCNCATSSSETRAMVETARARQGGARAIRRAAPDQRPGRRGARRRRRRRACRADRHGGRRMRGGCSGRNAIIGLSIKTDGAGGGRAGRALDYVGIGGVYATTSKDQKKPPIGVDGLAPHRRRVPPARSEISGLRHRRHQCRQCRRDHCRRRRRRVGDLGAVARGRSDRRRARAARRGRRRAGGAEARR